MVTIVFASAKRSYVIKLKVFPALCILPLASLLGPGEEEDGAPPFEHTPPLQKNVAEWLSSLYPQVALCLSVI